MASQTDTFWFDVLMLVVAFSFACIIVLGELRNNRRG
jgi:hypothetical protein